MFRFKLKYNAVDVEVFPVYNSSLSKRYKKKQDANFYEVALSGALRFIGADFDRIYTQPAGTAFEVSVEELVSGNWTSFFTGFFNAKMAKEVNVDDKKIVFELKDAGPNRDILKLLDKKINIIPKVPPIVRVGHKKRDILQLYFQSAKFVTNILAGNYWEEPLTLVPKLTASLRNTFGFKLLLAEGYCDLYFGLWPFDPDFGSPLGTWNASPNTAHGGEWQFENGQLGIAPNVFNTLPVYRAFGLSSNVTVGYRFIADGPFGMYYDDITTAPIEKFRLDSQMIFSRLLTDRVSVEDYGGGTLASIALPAQDITNQIAYNRAAPVDIPLSLITKSFAKTTTPTEWVVPFSNVYQYFVEPIFSQELPFPISRTSWQFASYWFNYDDEVRTMEDANFSDVLIKDNYLLSDVIKTLLQGSGIAHEATDVYSDILYGDAIKGYIWHPVLTPKSNFIIGDYDLPAKKAEVTLSDIFEMLKLVFKCYWFIDSSNRLRIEHISFFENGGSYSAEQVGLDLTELIQLKNNKPWSFNTNSFTFDGASIPESVEFEWADDQTLSFQGRSIDSVGADIEEGLIIKNKVSLFSADLDFISYNRDDISKEGFILNLCEKVDAFNYTVPLVEVENVPKGKKLLNNGWAAMEYLQNLLFVYSAPTAVLFMNEVNVNALTLAKSKNQTVSVPSSSSINEFSLVKTGLGNGTIEEASLNLSSGMLTLNLKIE